MQRRANRIETSYPLSLLIIRRPPALFGRIRFLSLCYSMLRRRSENALQRRFIAPRDFFLAILVVIQRFSAHRIHLSMNETPESQTEERHFAAIGRVAVQWAFFEAEIDIPVRN